MSAENEKFPRVGVYLLIQTSEKQILARKQTHVSSLPFALFQGGETWEELILELKKECGLLEAKHAFLGSGVAPQDHPYPFVYCIFKIELTPDQESKRQKNGFKFTKDLTLDPISNWICEKFGAAY